MTKTHVAFLQELKNLITEELQTPASTNFERGFDLGLIVILRKIKQFEAEIKTNENSR